MLSQVIIYIEGNLGTAAFVAACIFLFVFIAISFHLLHETGRVEEVGLERFLSGPKKGEGNG